MRQSDADAKKDRAADDCTEYFASESIHVALHQFHDWRIGDRSVAGCARAHAPDMPSSLLRVRQQC
jgi:hypothetical protein